METKKILQINSIAKSFSGLLAIENISFDLLEGQIVGLIGPNGAGKTTLMNIISGVHKPSRGDIIFDGSLLAKMQPHQICRLGIGRTFQIPRPFMNMTVLENLQVCSQHETVDYRWLLDIAGLWNKKNWLAKTLTFQERRLLELSRALTVKPKLLLLDEIAAGLNPAETMEMMALLGRIHDQLKVTILWIEHVMKAIMEHALHIIVLCQGLIIAEGSPQEIATNPKVVEAYLGKEYRF